MTFNAFDKVPGFDKLIAFGKDNAEALIKSSNATLQGLEELGKQSQAYAATSAQKLDGAVKAVLACKTPAELADINSKLARETIEQAIVDSRKFAELSQSLVTAAIEPISARVAAIQSLAKTAA